MGFQILNFCCCCCYEKMSTLSSLKCLNGVSNFLTAFLWQRNYFINFSYLDFCRTIHWNQFYPTHHPIPIKINLKYQNCGQVEIQQEFESHSTGLPGQIQFISGKQFQKNSKWQHCDKRGVKIKLWQYTFHLIFIFEILMLSFLMPQSWNRF